MTAELSILNKSGVVIAADSAVTIGKNNKVFNSATKMFQISNSEPIGLMIYSSANWMGIPMEIIIKQYSKKLGNNNFTELKEYARDFIDFLKNSFFSKVEKSISEETVEYRFYHLLETLIDITKTEFQDRINSGQLPKPVTTADEKKQFNRVFNELVKELSSEKIEEEILVDFKDYNISSFKHDYKKVLGDILKGFYSVHDIKRTGTITSYLYKFLFDELTHSFSDFEDYTGIVFAGYGIDQIFPGLTEIKLGEIISGRLRYEYTRDIEISHDKSAVVVPFAQRDMVDTFFQGVDPDLIDEIDKVVRENLVEQSAYINKKYKLNKLAELNKRARETHIKIGKEILKFRSEIHVQPVITSVSYLPKEDLIELAESLVNITSLKRKTSSDHHSVGGPVDIALISKGDGFKWIKRKE